MEWLNYVRWKFFVKTRADRNELIDVKGWTAVLDEMIVGKLTYIFTKKDVWTTLISQKIYLKFSFPHNANHSFNSTILFKTWNMVFSALYFERKIIYSSIISF